ncbi:hypothetical protein MKX01_036696 [Papaver californicum]|nr:hypothetical protein MKX01_036696 [Papaver californicum]
MNSTSLLADFLLLINKFSWLTTLFILSLLPFFLSFWLVRGGFAWRNFNQTKKYLKLRGLFGFPFFGSLPLMGSIPHRKLSKIATRLGATRLMAFSSGNTCMIISSDPETAKDILCGTSFVNRPVKISAKILMFERAIGFAPSGDYWRHIRRIATTHMFASKRISSLEGVRKNLSDKMIEEIVKQMRENGFVEMKVIILMSLKGLELRDLVEEWYELFGKFNWVDYLYFGFLDFHGVKRRCHKRKDGDANEKSDFLSVLLNLPQEDMLSDPDIVAILWEMIFRGTDTVSILMEWIMARMVLHPEIQAKAQEEIYSCVGSDRYVQDTDIANLPYLQSTVKEVLRMHPPGPLLSWSRLATEDVYIGEFFIPAGTTAMVNMWAITHDGSIWKDPLAFKPERFIEQDVNVMGTNLCLAPFGAGRRICPGKALGLTTVHFWLARLLQEFTWSPAKPVDLSERLRLSLEMKNPVVYRVVRRNTMMKSL